jgi:hypothetical protein
MNCAKLTASCRRKTKSTGKLFEEEGEQSTATNANANKLDEFATEAAAAYQTLQSAHETLFDWLRPDVFTEDLAKHLKLDAVHPTPSCRLPGCFPKIGSEVEFQIWQKIFARGETLASAFSTFGKATTYYSRKVNAFLQILDFVPEVHDGRGKLRAPSEFKELKFAEPSHAAVAFCLMNSTLFRWFMDVVSDGSHLNRRETDLFPFDPRTAMEFAAEFTSLGKKLSADLKKNSFERKMTYSHDTLTVQCIIPKFSKPILDEIDRVLARHYGFTAEELDFILNYDIKYRLGRDPDTSDD